MIERNYIPHVMKCKRVSRTGITSGTAAAAGAAAAGAAAAGAAAADWTAPAAFGPAGSVWVRKLTARAGFQITDLASSIPSKEVALLLALAQRLAAGAGSNSVHTLVRYSRVIGFDF